MFDYLKGSGASNELLIGSDGLQEYVSAVIVSGIGFNTGWEPRLDCLFATSRAGILKRKICVSPGPIYWVRPNGHAVLLAMQPTYAPRVCVYVTQPTRICIVIEVVAR